MPLIQVVVVLIVIGVVLWLANTKIPMQPWTKKIVNTVAIIAVALWLLSLFGPMDGESLWRGFVSAR